MFRQKKNFSLYVKKKRKKNYNFFYNNNKFFIIFLIFIDGCSLDGCSLNGCYLGGCSLNGCSSDGCFLDGCFLDNCLLWASQTMLVSLLTWAIQRTTLQLNSLRRNWMPEQLSGLLIHVTSTPPWLFRPVKASTSSELYPNCFRCSTFLDCSGIQFFDSLPFS